MHSRATSGTRQSSAIASRVRNSKLQETPRTLLKHTKQLRSRFLLNIDAEQPTPWIGAKGHKIDLGNKMGFWDLGLKALN